MKSFCHKSSHKLIFPSYDKSLNPKLVNISITKCSGKKPWQTLVLTHLTRYQRNEYYEKKRTRLSSVTNHCDLNLFSFLFLLFWKQSYFYVFSNFNQTVALKSNKSQKSSVKCQGLWFVSSQSQTVTIHRNCFLFCKLWS